jgi:hypothetical protein
MATNGPDSRRLSIPLCDPKPDIPAPMGTKAFAPAMHMCVADYRSLRVGAAPSRSDHLHRGGLSDDGRDKEEPMCRDPAARAARFRVKPKAPPALVGDRGVPQAESRMRDAQLREFGVNPTP